MSNHGTYAMYQRHLRRGEDPCAECRAANAAYIRGLRATNADMRGKDAAQTAAYRRAMVRLREAHRDEFLALYEEEKP